MSESIDHELEEILRGAVTVDTRDELEKKWKRSKAKGIPLRVKLGVDPTSSSLHLGFTVPLRKMRQFQDAGHIGVLIIGDYTACVGDPTGRSKTRPQLSYEEVRANAETYLAQLWQILDKDKTEVVYNGDWFKKMSFLETISLAAKTTVAQMLVREDFSKRFKSEQPISLHEFLYPLMQAQDSVEIKADVELGGTDQTFNLLLGRDLMRQAELEPQICLTTPLLVGTDGELKMSKSYNNFIGIDEDANTIFGKCMSVPDDLMRDYFVLVTDCKLAEIDEILAGNPRDAKAKLAHHITRMYCGEQGAVDAEAHFNRVFRDKKDPEDMEVLELDPSSLEDGKIWIVELIKLAGFAQKNNEARRKVEGGGVRLGDDKVTDPSAKVEPQSGQVLKVGKKNFKRIEL